MDIELLSSIVRKLILESDEVAVPGLGTFSATLVSASFSDRGYTINPPYRKLDFIPSEALSSDGMPSVEDGQAAADVASEVPKGREVPAIIGRIAAARKIDESQAAAELAECIKTIRTGLDSECLAELPGLGRLRLTKEGEIFFVAAEELNIYPEGFGLEPVSLKNREAQAADSAPAVVAAPAAPAASVALAATPVTTPKVRKSLPVAVRVVIIIVAVLLVAAVALRVLGAVAPDFVDRLLYSSEELEILRQSL